MDQENFTAMVSHLNSTIGLNSCSLKFEHRYTVSFAATARLDLGETVKYNRRAIYRIKTY